MNIGTRYLVNKDNHKYKSWNVVNNNTNRDVIEHVGEMSGNDFEYDIS